MVTGLASLLCCTSGLSSQDSPTPAPQEKKQQVIPAMKLQGMPTAKPRVPTTEELTKLYEEALAEPFVKKGSWMIDYDAARARAKEEGKLIFAYFTRSYAY
ncbi:MAG TPA: hypothetical protein PKE00_07020 [Planctomycetota bacterium]|nr:hypothetical protein [Planctomycetota bacterium]